MKREAHGARLLNFHEPCASISTIYAAEKQIINTFALI